MNPEQDKARPHAHSIWGMHGGYFLTNHTRMAKAFAFTERALAANPGLVYNMEVEAYTLDRLSRGAQLEVEKLAGDGFYDGLMALVDLESLSDEELETVYALGYNYFVIGKYEAAKGIFTGLTAYAPYTGHYWRALGAVNQQLQKYAEAIEAYDMAIANDEMDIVSLVYRGESRILYDEIAAGLEDFTTVIEIGSEWPAFAPWVQRAELLVRLHSVD